MSNYNSLKTTIDANIKQNGRQEITGQILNSVLNQMVTTLGAGYQFAGVATLDPATDPGTPDAKVFYIANGKGTYTNFGGVEVTEDDVVVLYWDSSWHKVSTGIASQEKLTELSCRIDGFYTEDERYYKCIIGLWYKVPSTVTTHEVVLSYFGIDPTNNLFYVGFYDKTESKLIGYKMLSHHSSLGGKEVFDIPALDGSVTSYSLTDIHVIVDWDNYESSMYLDYDLNTIKISYKYAPITLKYLDERNDKLALQIQEKVKEGKIDTCRINGIYTDDIRYNNCIIQIDFDAPSNIVSHEVVLWYYGIETDSNKFYFGIYDKTEEKRVGYAIGNTVYSSIPHGIEIISFASLPYGNDASYTVSNIRTIINWDNYRQGMFVVNGNVDIKLSVFKPTAFNYLNENLLENITKTNNVDRDVAKLSGRLYAKKYAYYNIIRSYTGIVPSQYAENEICLLYFGILGDSNNKFYIGLWDMTLNKRIGYWLSHDDISPIPTTGTTTFNVNSWAGNDTPYIISNFSLTIDWSYYSVAYNIDNGKDGEVIFAFEIPEVPTGFDYQSNEPVLPNQLFICSDKTTKLYKGSLFTDYYGKLAEVDTFLIGETATGRSAIQISEPANIKYNDFITNCKIVLSRQKDRDKLVYKDVQVFNKDTTTLNGKSVSVLSMGDSLTMGRYWSDTPVTMLADALEKYGVTTTFIGSLAREWWNSHSVKVKVNYEGRGGWRYRTLVGLESTVAGENVIIPESQTKSEYLLGVDGETMNDLTVINTWLYPATPQDLLDNPEWCFHYVNGNLEYNKSYAEDSTLGDYIIFDPVRYFSLRNISIPDVVTIAFGTNEWYLNEYGGFDLQKATSCAEFIIKQLRKASASMKIVVIPLNNLPTTRDEAWKQSALPLCASVMKMVQGLIDAGDSNLFVCPIYAQGSRALAFNGTVGVAQDISLHNDVKVIGIDNNVHMLYEDDESRSDYQDALANCIANLIS